MEEQVLEFIFEKIKSLDIKDCDVYLNRPTIVGEKEKRHKSYVIVSFPNGFEDLDAIGYATGLVTIGTKDKDLGLPYVKGITKISKILKDIFPILTDDYSFINFEFKSDDSEGVGWHEYYYAFQLYINH